MNALESFVFFLLRHHGSDPLQMRRVSLFFDNTLTKRDFQRLFVQAAPHHTCVMPRMYTWQNLTPRDINALMGQAASNEHIVAPNLRNLMLMQCLNGTYFADRPLAFKERFAQSLAHFIDELNYSGTTIADCISHLPAYFQDQWGDALALIEDIMLHWQQSLDTRAQQDHSHMAAQSWQNLYRHWLIKPPQDPVYFIGNVPDYQALAPLKTWIRNYDSSAWIRPHHADRNTHPLYRALTSEYATQVDTHNYETFAEKVHFIEANNPEHEAELITQLIRNHCATSAASLLIVSDDVRLKKTLATHLEGFGIDIGHTRTSNLAETALGQLTITLAAGLSSWSTPEMRFAVLKMLQPTLSPWHEAEYEWRSALHPDTSVLTNAIGHEPETIPPRARVSEFVRIHKSLCQQYAAAHFGDAHPERFAIRDSWVDLANMSHDWSEITVDEYAYVWRTMLEDQALPATQYSESRIQFAKLEDLSFFTAETVIIPHMNDDSFPPPQADNPWIPQHVLEAMMIGNLDHQARLLDNFINLFSAQRIYCCRSSASLATPEMPSPWWIRLRSFLEKPTSLVATVRDTLPTKQTTKPSVAVPIALRPPLFSATEIESLMRDPYIIFAKKILRLRPLREYDNLPSAADKGNFIHRALELFIKHRVDPRTKDAHATLLDFAKTACQESAIDETTRLLWWPRFEKMASWFLNEQCKRHDHIAQSYVEMWGQCTLILSDNTPITLRAKVDRIDISHSRTATIIDYKTGTPPTHTDVKHGFAPQLVLEALILQKKGFADIPHCTLDSLEFWELKSSQDAGKIHAVKADWQELLPKTEQGLRELLEYYQRAQTSFSSNDDLDTRPAYNDYEDLSRYRLWIQS